MTFPKKLQVSTGTHDPLFDNNKIWPTHLHTRSFGDFPKSTNLKNIKVGQIFFLMLQCLNQHRSHGPIFQFSGGRAKIDSDPKCTLSTRSNFFQFGRSVRMVTGNCGHCPIAKRRSPLHNYDSDVTFAGNSGNTEKLQTDLNGVLCLTKRIASNHSHFKYNCQADWSATFLSERSYCLERRSRSCCSVLSHNLSVNTMWMWSNVKRWGLVWTAP